MAAPSGIASQIAYGTEGDVGLPTTVPTLHLPLVSESLKLDKAREESESIIAGQRVLTSDQWNGGNNTVAGDVAHELYNRGLGTLFLHMFGNVVTTGVGPYNHEFTPGDLTDQALCALIGRPDVLGVVHPMFYTGLKVASWEIACSAGKKATIGLTFAGMREFAGSRGVTDGVLNSTTTLVSATAVFTEADKGKPLYATGLAPDTVIDEVVSATTVTLSIAATATAAGVSVTIGMALPVPTIPTGIKPFKFNHGTIRLGGSKVRVKAATLAGDNGLEADRYFVGDENADEALETDLRAYDGSLEMEFRGLDTYNDYLNGTELELEMGFSSGADSVTITENVRLDGETSTIAGRGILTANVPFKAIAKPGLGDGSAITAVLVNSDATV